MQTNFSEISPYKQYRRYNCIVIFSKYRIEVFNYQYHPALAHTQHVDTHTHTHTHTPHTPTHPHTHHTHAHTHTHTHTHTLHSTKSKHT